jgi:predicted secreted protein
VRLPACPAVVYRVIEDRGPLGSGGKRIWRLRSLAVGSELETEVREEQLELLAVPAAAQPITVA